MAGPSPELAASLDAIVSELRRFLRDLDEDEIPAGLRRVAAATGRKLPPPLLRSLLVEMDRNEWLRTKAAESIDGKSIDGESIGGEAGGPVAAYLRSEPGWWIDIADQAVAAAERRRGRHDETAEIDKLRSRLEEGKRRTGELRAANAELEAEVRDLRSQVRELAEDAERARLAAASEARLRTVEEQLDRERKLRREADARVSEIMRRREERRRRAEHASGGERTGGGGDPVGMARRLDLERAALAAAARPDTATPPEEEPAHVETRFTLPAGLAPDSEDAVRWLLGLGAAVTLVVDGYNLGRLLDPDADPALVRRQLLFQLDRFDRLAGSAHRIIVVFDSDQTGSQAPVVGPSGIEVRFATEAECADDEIVALVSALTTPTVVVTNDRDLRERVERSGVVSLWSTAFASWVAGA